ncbi:hypothetical protein DFJ58DRAFT_731945 [Suillus subalutaceus]|uniref:uncharacterized protein n=1 Tax=Suillus subalutaceus TaxID=48586 RepID=UPI001B870E5B|nr:uncharacterized protein DFJ58DRAFT_731945 [Suillus subalutaceus]KAG1842629.1 hypothetical protein DFJ58DRAFT_731945 [Suillus subalutaceus]
MLDAGWSRSAAQASCRPALSIASTSLSTLGSSVIAPTPPQSPHPPLTSLTGALFQLPETLLLTVTPYFIGEADADVRWVKWDEALHKELVGAITYDYFVYLYCGILYNMPAVPGKSGPYYCVTHGRYIGVFNHWEEVTENIKGYSDVVYTITSLTIGEVLLRAAIDKGEVHMYPK